MKEYYGEQTKKAIRNFPFNFRKLPKSFFHIIAEIKKANALAHLQAKELDKKTAMAIAKACDEVVAGKFDEQFVLPAFQGGAGTSNHMNVNEVIASRATEILFKTLTPNPSPKGRGGSVAVHPNDHVNMAQSTNDVMPSALRILSYRLSQNLVREIDQFIKILEKKSCAV
jgi:aspartate ammonia-lyase